MFVWLLLKEDWVYFLKSGVILIVRNWNCFLVEVMVGMINVDGEFLDWLFVNYVLSFDLDEKV